MDAFNIRARKIYINSRSYNDLNKITSIKLNSTAAGLYMLSVNGNSEMIVVKD